jgi:hypothetical protein
MGQLGVERFLTSHFWRRRSLLVFGYLPKSGLLPAAPFLIQARRLDDANLVKFSGATRRQVAPPASDRWIARTVEAVQFRAEIMRQAAATDYNTLQF